MWYTYGTKYDSGIENSPSERGRVRRVAINRIKNSDFYAGWTQVKGHSSDSFTLDDDNLCMSIRGAKIVKGGAGEATYNTTAALFESGNYTFSAYVKTSGLTVPEGKKARLYEGRSCAAGRAVFPL